MPAHDEFKAGDVLAGRYRVKRVLGKGGMGLVVAATDSELHRNVAIKLLLPALVADPEALARFRREARAAVLLTSEHAVRVHDVGELPSGVPFMVMELLAGKDLDDVVRERQRLPHAEAVDYVLQAIEAIAEAHGHGVIHRDIKPRNVFLTHKASGAALVKVLDFGLAKSTIPGEQGLTNTFAVMGSPEYMSPEQMRGTRDVDARTDIWALGVTLYELLTGGCPFVAPSTPELFIKVFQEKPRPPHEVYADIPFGLSRVILRCLEKTPDARYPTVAELAAALEEFASPSAEGTAARVERVLQTVRPGRVLSSAPPPAMDDAGPTQRNDGRAETVTAAAFDSSPQHRRLRLKWSVGVGALVGLLAVATSLLYGRSTATPDEPTSGTALPGNPASSLEQADTSIGAPPGASAAAMADGIPSAVPAGSGAGLIPSARQAPSPRVPVTVGSASHPKPSRKPAAGPDPGARM
jgi:serine/threonine protein kinase